MSSARTSCRVEAHVAVRCALLAAFALGCAACSVHLAPRADAALAAELRSANRDAQVLLQQLRAPAPGACAARRERYADLIGRLHALEMQANARELPRSDAARPGDLMVLADSLYPCHVAIRAEQRGEPTLIHALAAPPYRRVCETLYAPERPRVRFAFALPGVED